MSMLCPNISIWLGFQGRPTENGTCRSVSRVGVEAKTRSTPGTVGRACKVEPPHFACALEFKIPSNQEPNQEPNQDRQQDSPQHSVGTDE